MLAGAVGMKKLPVFLLAVMVLARPDLVLAGPIDIHVWHSTHTVSVRTTFDDYQDRTFLSRSNQLRTTTDTFGAGESIDYGDMGHATATANDFEVFVDANAVWKLQKDQVSSAGATASLAVDFSPVADAMGEVTIDRLVGYATYTNAAITLLNLTTNTVLWDTGWDYVNESKYGTAYYYSDFVDGPVSMLSTLSASDTTALVCRRGLAPWATPET